jgi:predicted nucleic acid-binding protein
MLLLSENFTTICNNAYIYLDTNFFIYAQNNDEITQIIEQIKINHKATLLTINSVEYEYTRGARSIEEIKTRRNFIASIADGGVVPFTSILKKDKTADIFSAIMSKIVQRKDSDYTDYLLASALHQYKDNGQKQFILSADARAYPARLFDIAGVITASLSNNDIIHLNLINLNQEKYKKLIEIISRGTEA